MCYTHCRHNGGILWRVFILGWDFTDMEVLYVTASEYNELVGLGPRWNGLGNLPIFRTKGTNYEKTMRGQVEY